MVTGMEQVFESSESVQELAGDAWIHVNAAGVAEVMCALIAPLLAVLLAIRINRWIDSRPKETPMMKFFDFIGPMIAPLLAMLLITIAAITLQMLEIKAFVLPFLFKLTFAWLAIRLVSIMSTRQGAGWVIALVIVPITLLHLFDLWQPVTNTLMGMKFAIGKTRITAYGVLKAVAVVIGLFWITGFLIRATDTRLRKVRGMHVSNRVLVMKIVQILMYFVVFLVGLQVVGVDLTALSVLGGALGVGIGFGLQKIASNFISGIILLFEKSAQVDDLIELSDGTRGYIRQTAARYTRLELFDGREIFIPNEEFITQRITTLTHSSRRTRVMLPIGVGYGSDVDLVQKLLVEAALSHERCMQDPAPFAEMYEFGESSLNFNLFFWVEDVTSGIGGPRHGILKEVLRLFDEHGIDIPYPHQVQVGDPAMIARVHELEEALARAEATTKEPAPAAPTKTPRKRVKPA